MVKKINLNFVLVTAVSIFLTSILTTFVFYRNFQKEVFSELSSFAHMVDHLDLMQRMREQSLIQPGNELRITWIGPDGAVLYDSYAGDAQLNNHRERPEVAKALETGEGSCIRRSETMGQNIFFYARRADDGTVIRIAKEAGNIWTVFGSALPITVLLAVLSFFLCMWMAGRLTRAFVRPIEELATHLDRDGQTTAYRELAPVLALIRTQHEEIMRNAKIRQEFAANVSHELKTPLTSISGYAELIATGMASKKKARYFAGEIHENAQRLLVLINDILQLSELDDAPAEDLTFEPVDLYEAAAQCVTMLAPSAKKHGVTLELDGDPVTVWADRMLIGELLYNLCDNAIRYNKEDGHVWVTVGKELVVKDDGIGIPEKHQKRVFERFFRVDKSRSKKTGGTGLGLAIVKHIAEAHHAMLSLESEEGVGTTVRVGFTEYSYREGDCREASHCVSRES